MCLIIKHWIDHFEIYQGHSLSWSIFHPTISNANWAGCLDNKRSTSGLRVFYWPQSLSFVAPRNSPLFQYSIEAEYHSLGTTIAYIHWLLPLHLDLDIHIPQQLQLHCDKVRINYLSSSPVLHARTKHEVYGHLFKEELQWCSSHCVHD